MELPGIQRDCYSCYIVGIMTDCKLYQDLVENNIIKQGDRCMTLSVIDADVDKALRNDPHLTYHALTQMILEEPKHPVPRPSSHCSE